MGGGPSGGPSGQAAISANGRWLAFASAAPDLVVGDTNGAVDVFVRDRRTGTTVRLPIPGGAPVPPRGSATDPSISADGSTVAFVYTAPPVTGLAVVPGRPVIVAWTRSSGASEVVSLAGNGSVMPDSTEPSVSGDGRLVAFTTRRATATTPTEDRDVWVRDRSAGTTRLVSVDRDGGQAGGDSSAPAISRDGRVVAFQSDAFDLVEDDRNRQLDVFARDLVADRTEMVSVSLSANDGPSELPSISADGRFVAFESLSSTLVAGDPRGTRDVFLRDRSAATTTLVSIGLDGGPVEGQSGQASIGADGRVVAFASTASGLVAQAGSTAETVQLRGRSEVYARDVVAGETILISVTPAGAPGGSTSVAPAVAGVGRYVAFGSTAENLVPADGNGHADVFVRDLPPVPVLEPPVIDFGSGPVGLPTAPGAATLRNDGWSPLTATGSSIAGLAAGDFGVAFDGCAGRTLRRTDACTVTVSFVPSAPGERTAELRVTDDAAGSPRVVLLRGGASQASLRLDPPLGRPGIVTIATGAGFPAGAEVRLTWSRGQTPTIVPIVVDASGGFRVQVLVFHNDLMGRRELVADPAGGPTFPQVRARFDVVPAPAQPPRFLVGRPIDDPPPPIVIRR